MNPTPAELAAMVKAMWERHQEVVRALVQARSMLGTAMREDLPGWSDKERKSMIDANPGIKLIDAAIANANKPLTTPEAK